MNNQEFINKFQLRKYGSKGWYGMSDKLNCPFCGAEGKSGKFAVIINETGISSYHCFSANCPSPSGTVWKLLKELGYVYETRYQEKLVPLYDDIISQEKKYEFVLPEGFKKIKPLSSGYLNDRGWTKEQYEKYCVGVSNLHDMYLFFILKENDKPIAYLGRTTKSKDWHRGHKDVPRYNNSKHTPFNEIVGNIDSIKEDRSVVIVEGIMDSISIENKTSEFIPVFTNGAKLSIEQAKKISDKNPKNVIIMYDPGTEIVTLKSVMIMKLFHNDVRYTILKEKDPGDMNKSELLYHIDNNIIIKDEISVVTSKI